MTLAADEDVSGLAAVARIIAARAAQVLVVKPLVVGGLTRARAIVEMASTAGLPVVVTTTVDTGVATAAALHLAAGLPPGTACGLATAQLLASDLLAKPLAVVEGAMAVPETPGLGITVSDSELARFAQGPDRRWP